MAQQSLDDSFETCNSLDNLIANRNQFAFASCSKNDPPCDTVTCQIIPGYYIETAKLTLLSCKTPPAINIVVGSSSLPLQGNFTFSESATGPWITLQSTRIAYLDWDFDYFIEDATFTGFQV